MAHRWEEIAAVWPEIRTITRRPSQAERGVFVSPTSPGDAALLAHLLQGSWGRRLERH